MVPTRGVAQRTVGPDIMAAVPGMVYRASSRTDAWSFTAVQGGLPIRLGTQSDELCGDPGRWLLMVHRADRHHVVSERRRAVDTGRLELEYRVLTPDGGDCWVHDVAVRDGSGDGMCGIVTDLTEHRRAADVLAELQDAQLAAVTRRLHATSARDTTVQLFVHDIRSPLTGIARLARAMQEDGGRASTEDRDRAFERMLQASDRVLALVDDLVRFWDLAQGRAEVPVGSVQVDRLVSDAMAEVGLDDHDVCVDVNDVVVHTNAPLLTRVLVGLLRNAVQHTPPGASVAVSAAVCGDVVVIEVEDDGPGIPAELRDRLLTPRPPGWGDAGLGIGLSLAHAAVELLGGEVCVLDGPAGGTVVRVQLPRPSTVGGVGSAVA